MIRVASKLFSLKAGRRQRGQVLVMTALMLPVLMGFAGLAVDVGLLMMRRTDEQRAADAAAIAGAQAWLSNGKGTASGQSESEAVLFATKNGYTDAVNDTSVEITYPSSCGLKTTYSNCIKVTISRTAPNLFMRVLGKDKSTVTASAIGVMDSSPRPYALIV